MEAIENFTKGLIEVSATREEWAELFAHEAQSTIDEFKAALQLLGVRVR
jgi:hypothetical protein